MIDSFKDSRFPDAFTSPIRSRYRGNLSAVTLRQPAYCLSAEAPAQAGNTSAGKVLKEPIGQNFRRISLRCPKVSSSFALRRSLCPLRLVILSLYLTFGIVSLQAQGGYADAFLNIGTSPRSVGLGQAVSALPQHPGGYLVNPAATGFVSSPTFTGMFVNQFGMADYLSLGLSMPKGSSYQWGIHTVNLFIDDILERPDLRKISDLETRRDSIRSLVAKGFNSFKDWEFALTFNFSKNILYVVDPGWQFTVFPVKLPVGLNVKLLHKDLHKVSAWGIGIDLGTMFIVDLEQVFIYDWLGDFVLGVSLNNIAGTRLYWNTDKKDLIPMQLVTGLSYRQKFTRFPMTLTVFEQQNNVYPGDVQMGVEIIVFDKISVRGGSSYGFLQGGLGFIFKRSQKSVALNYSFSNHDLGNAHRIGGWLEL